MSKIPIGIIGATGMVGQRLITLLHNHPMFEIHLLVASPSSAGKSYKEAVLHRWFMDVKIPKHVASMVVQSLDAIDTFTNQVSAVFCALDMDKKKIQELEFDLAKRGLAVISNNSAHRWTEEVPMMMPEINAKHIKLIDVQRKKHGWDKGLVVVKPNCSIQSYVTILTALDKCKPIEVKVVSLQAISGAGKTFDTWPEMVDNVIPYIGDEEEKSEKEPMKIWGKTTPHISATCIRVPVSNGHMATVSVKFERPPSYKGIMSCINVFNKKSALGLPSSPKKLIHVFEVNDRPQTRLDRDLEGGMAISVGRIRKSNTPHYDWEFISLSHNTLRGAAGGSVLTAEFLHQKGFF